MEILFPEFAVTAGETMTFTQRVATIGAGPAENVPIHHPLAVRPAMAFSTVTAALG
jgi:hypothetical protein